MNEADISIDIHTLKLQDWLISRRITPKNIQAPIKCVRSKITNALQDMPSNEQLIKLLSGTNINYYHCKEIVEILKQTEKDTKSVFGTYGSKRMKDWQEIIRLYERDNIYLGEAAQIYVRNINYEIPGVRRQMTKLDQQSDECLKRIQDLGKPEAQLLSEHAALLQELGVKGENLHEEFLLALSTLPELYEKSLKEIGTVNEAIDLYAEFSDQPKCLPILKHMISHGNTTVYQYLYGQVPTRTEEPAIKLNLSIDTANTSTNNTNNDNADGSNNEIDFCLDNNGGTSSTISAEIIDFGDLNVDSSVSGEDPNNDGDIDWGTQITCIDSISDADLTIIDSVVIESEGIDGMARGEQVFTILDSPNYRDRFLDELYELEAFLRMRLYELNQLDATSNIMFSLVDNLSTHDSESIRKMLTNLENIIQEICNEHIRHLFQLKHSPKYADLLANKLKQMTKAVEKIRANKEQLKIRSIELNKQRLALNPVLDELNAQTKQLQLYIENDISKRYKNRVVNLIGGANN